MATSQAERSSDTDGRLTHRPLREVVAAEIRGMIVSGQIAPGERLVEDKLAAELGVSRNPVREAIRSLEATGLVDVVPRKGAYACLVDGDDIRQIQELRAAINGWAAELAAVRRTEDHLRRMRSCIDVGRASSMADDAVRAAEQHREFHLIMESAAGNPFIGVVLNPLRHRTEMVFSILLDRRGALAWDEHEEIYDAIADKDPELARLLVERHILSALTHYEQALESVDGQR
jgi:DNA-binding GntR family transcriptional regulator